MSQHINITIDDMIYQEVLKLYGKKCELKKISKSEFIQGLIIKGLRYEYGDL
jgi:hypothetical protein